MDRRRTRRYVLETPLRGNIMPMHDVTVEQFSEDRAILISTSGHMPDEKMIIHMTTPQGLQSHPATVVSSSPVSYGGSLCFRIDLRMDDRAAPAIDADESRKDVGDEPR
jgi:hypothetical protein